MTLAKLACALLLTTGLAAPAFAAEGDAGSGPTTGATHPNDAGSGPTQSATSNSSTTNGQGSTSNGQNAMNTPGIMHLTHKLRDDLSRAGFTDLKIMPTSFLISGKDSQGNPVMMVLSPNSVTALTEQTQPNAASNASSNQSAPNSAGATSAPASTGGAQPVAPDESKP